MILLHNQHDKASREFLEKYRDHFKNVLNYEESVKKYAVSRFPAVVLGVPKITVDNSLYAALKRIPDYRHLGIRVGDGYKKYGGPQICSESKSMLLEWRDRKGLKDDDIWYIVDSANEGEIPASWIMMGILMQDRFDEPCKNDLYGRTKKRSCKGRDETKDLKEVKERTIEILYPQTIEECYKRLEQFDLWKNKVGPQK